MAKTNNEEYRKKLMPIDEAVRMVKPVDRVFVGFASATAFALMDALWDRRAELEHVQILCSNGQRDCRMYSEDPGELGDPFEFNTAFMGYSERIARKHGRKVTFTSCPLSEVDAWMRDIAKPRVAFLLVSPPDEDGNMAMNLYEVEENSRIECLRDFKESFFRAANEMESCLRKLRPEMPEEDRNRFRYTFFPFMNGVYPYAHPTCKQCEAMDMVGICHPSTSVYELAYYCLIKLLK